MCNIDLSLTSAQSNSELTEEIRNKISESSSVDSVKDVLELEYRVGVLELENMELEYCRMLHDLVVRQKDMCIRKLQLQVRGLFCAR